MKYFLLFLPLLGLGLSSCGTINETMSSMAANREAIDMSTYAISENREAIEEATRGIEENRRHLEKLNETLRKESESEENS